MKLSKYAEQNAASGLLKILGMNRTLILFFLLMLLNVATVTVYAQAAQITGVITDEQGVPLPGATVLVKGTANGAQSDFDGNYSIEANIGDTLIFSYIGFTPQEEVVSNQTIINVTLGQSTAVLDEVVVTGYGSQSRSTLTSSVSKLDTKVLESATRSNPATALQGTVAGLRVTNTSGQPGSTPQVVLRGGTNFSGNDAPLILVDGVPSSFYALNSDDIESMEVLKDAAATAIYGARSANGVILITTKKGKAGRSSINYKYRYSINSERNDQQYLGAADHINYNRQSIAWFREATNNPGAFGAFLDGNQSAGTGNNATNDPFTTQLLTAGNQYLLNQPGWQSIPDILNPGQQIIFYDNKDVGDRIYQNSESKDHYLSFDGGNEKGTYYLGLGLLDNQGLILGSGFKRYSGKFSGSYKVTNNVEVNSNILYSHSNLNLSPLGSEDTVFRRFQGQASTSRTYDSNPDGTFSDQYAVGQNQGFGNPLYYQDKFVRKNLEQRLQLSVGLDWDIINDLTFSLSGSHFAINNHNESFNRAFRTGSTEGPLRTAREASVGLDRVLRNQITGTLNYTKRFGLHNVNALIGAEYFKDNFFETSAGTRNSPTDLIETLNAGAEANGIPYSFETEYVITSTFGRLLYDYDNRYLVGFTFRNDGSSRLGNNKYGFFPGVSLGWNAHNENFFQDSGLDKTITKFKPRLSYGVNGNQDVLSNYGVYGSYGSQGVYNGQTGYANTSLATLDLKWEKATTFNIGLDVALFDNRLSLIADAYTRDIKDKLASLTLPYYTGFSGILTNNGTYRNRGFELQVNGDILRKEDFTWSMGATFTRNRNYVVALPENDNELNRQGGSLIWNPETGQEEWVGGLQEGQRFGGDLVVAFEQEKIYANQAEADADNSITDEYAPAASRNQRWAGDVKWVDQNGDGVINNLDRKVIGRTTPDLVGGFNTSLTYKNFSLFVQTDFATGHLVWNHIRNKGYAQTQGNLAQPVEVLDSWTPNNTDTEWPRFVFVNGTKNVWRGNESVASLQTEGNEQFWEKGDYLALREVTLRYSFPSEYFNDVIKRLSVNVTGSNLHYFKSMSGDTPEVGGVQYGEFPVPKTITIGLNVTF
ncbi:TonB-dependent receptor plug [Allomuricauda ruestringensis DSM 13258]|uniref:TonB-dependent receptor plug n=1 Tax=Allomuricauda ruestringensis (strain DSM 13258 / CIP 107369 / LMG 19739 / B1) TaxID=886377 RepID=G2PS13_ALLRU|nr:TonB-dependent receptor [Allomuricauda ruestringensis]AEM69603.1 TonB-dependent receptor plug [Allomuricauda ruestringensis DSM 13258]